MNKKIFGVLVIAFTGMCTFLFYTFYNDAKDTAIRHINETQLVHAKVAARGIEGYFANWTGVLNALSKTDDIISNNADGKRLMKLLYEAHQNEILSINRVNEKGITIYSTEKKRIGTDVSGLKHIQELLKHRQTIISDMFTTAEGVNTISLHMPIFKDANFNGSIGIMINYRSIAKSYLDEIKIGKTGHAWVISHDGTELYNPEPGFTGKSIFENLKGYPSFTPMLNEMLKGRQGYATYQFDRASGEKTKLTTKLAVYVPVHLRNTFWSIVVVSNQEEALSSLVSFRNRLILIMVVFFIFGITFITYGTQAWLIVKEEGKRKKAEALLKESEDQYHNIYDNALEGMFQISTKGEYIKANKALARMLGYIVENSAKPSDYDHWLDPNEKIRYRSLFDTQDVVLGFECQFRRLDGEIIWVSLNSKLLRDKAGNKLYYEGFVLDITEQKENELIIKKKIEDLQWHYDIAINRELKMVELKKEIAELSKKLNKEEKE
jgi:two-component system, cell cycle sensor histidine kinase and response regulator CckA